MELNVKNVIAEGLAYTVMGIVVVFSVLVLIMLVIKAMALFSSEKTQAEEAPVQAPAAAPVATEIKPKSDDTELVAAITAAIAAVMGKSASSLVIRSYKKISGNVWNRAGRNETLENRF